MKAKIDVRKRIESARKSFQTGDYARALQDIDEVLRLDESNTEAMSLRDQIAAAGQREAVAMAADAVRQADSEADPDRRVAILHAAALRNPEDQHLQMLLVLNESRRDVLAALAARARFFDRKRRFDDALEQLRRLETLHPAFPGLAELRATVQRHKEHPEEVVEAPPPVFAATVLPAAPQPAVAPPEPPQPPVQRHAEPVLPPPPAAKQEPKPQPPPSPAAAKVATPSPSRRMLWVGLAAAAVLIAAIGAYFLKSGGRAAPAGKFELALQPADARIEIDGKPQDAATLSLNPGTYKVKVTRPGYKTREEQITYSGGGLRFDLEPLNPLIRIDTNLPGGEYVVDDQPAKPLEEGQVNLSDLPPGRHKVKVSFPKNGESTIEVDTAVAKLPQFVSATVAKDVASFAISTFDNAAALNSNVPNLPIKLDSGDAIGTTGIEPVTINGTSGAEKRLVIGEGDQQQLMTAIFDSRPEFFWILRGAAPGAGSVRVKADQDEVIVRIDGKQQATKLKSGEPHSFRDLSPGKHEVRVEKPGYIAEPVSLRITVTNGHEEKVEFRLLGFATVEIRGAPAGARVLINNVASGSIGPDGSGHFSSAAKGAGCRLELKLENSLHKPVEKPCKPGETVSFSGDEVKMAPSGFLMWEKYEPKDATITITRKGGGEKIVATPPHVELPVGKYVVQVTAPGYKTHTDEVEVMRGRESLMVYELVREK